MKDYRIAGHCISIDFADPTVNDALLPNFAPFKYEGNEEPILKVNIVSDHSWEQEAKEIGLFDVGGSNHGVYRNIDGGYRFDVYNSEGHLCSRMQSSADFRQCFVKVYEGTFVERHFGLNNCMMMAYAFATADMDTVLIHSSVIRCDGKGYLMTAPSGTGKSTHTHLWYTTIPGCDLMNDDNPIIRIADGKPVVYGSPWSGKTPCYINNVYPVGGVVRLRQAAANSFHRQEGVAAFVALLPGCSVIGQDEALRSRLYDTVGRLAQIVTVGIMDCTPHADAAAMCHAALDDILKQ